MGQENVRTRTRYYSPSIFSEISDEVLPSEMDSTFNEDDLVSTSDEAQTMYKTLRYCCYHGEKVQNIFRFRHWQLIINY